MSALKPGLAGEASIVVGEEHTAESVGSGRVGVLATPVMINLIEAAALQAIEAYLPAGHQSLGTHLDVSHVAATPVGMRATAAAELIKIEDRLLHFRVSARDEVDEIGSGTHQRIIVDVEKFAARVARKLKSSMDDS